MLIQLFQCLASNILVSIDRRRYIKVLKTGPMLPDNTLLLQIGLDLDLSGATYNSSVFSNVPEAHFYLRI